MQEALGAVSLEKLLYVACYYYGLRTFQHNVKLENLSIVGYFLVGDTTSELQTLLVVAPIILEGIALDRKEQKTKC